MGKKSLRKTMVKQSSFSEEDLFTEDVKSPYAHLPWKYYGVWRCICTIKCYLIGRGKQKTETNKFGETAETIISSLDKLDTNTLNTGKELLSLQRDVENTRARRRLEKWACRVIVAYLIVVCILIILNGLSMIWKVEFSNHGFISDKIMAIILSTTTINIIGLVVIVLRGHFEIKEKENLPNIGSQSSKRDSIAPPNL